MFDILYIACMYVIILERRHSRVVENAWLLGGKAPADRAKDTGLRHPLAGKLSQSARQ